jgi:transcriptional antiterminator NusG
MVEEQTKPVIFGLRTTANREDQVMDFLTANAEKKKFAIFSVIRAHGMRGYIFVEAATREDAEQAAFGIPYSRGILPKDINYSEIEHMLEQVKVDVDIRKNDIVEIISGPFKREQAKISRIDKTKEEVVVELLEAAVPIPITVKMDAVKVIRRESDDNEEIKEEEIVPIAHLERRPIHMPGASKPKEEVSDIDLEELPAERDTPKKQKKSFAEQMIELQKKAGAKEESEEAKEETGEKEKKKEKSEEDDTEEEAEETSEDNKEKEKEAGDE